MLLNLEYTAYTSIYISLLGVKVEIFRPRAPVTTTSGTPVKRQSHMGDIAGI